ncbi:tetratricopeptide repeat protein [bacterium]|nr:tetratricopeptide repeat protein [candidate division CSSED10-310 bacterium]
MAFNKRKILRNAQKFTHKRQWDRAIAEYEKLTQEDFGDTSLDNVIGDLCLNKGDIAKAIHYFGAASEYYRERGFAAKSIAILKKIQRLDPTQSSYYERLADLYAEKGLVQDAIEQLTMLAQFYEKLDNVEKALETYYKISDLEPANIGIKVRLGEIYERQGLNDHASEEYARVAEAYVKLGELGSAFSFYKKSYSLDEDNINALKGIVSVYLNTDQIGKALDTIKLLLEKAPDDLQALFIMGRTYLQDGDQESALPVFEHILELAPDQDGVREIVGRIYLQQGEFTNAKNMLETVVDAFMKDDSLEDAIKILQQLQAANPRDVSVRLKIAKLFMKLQMEERAFDEYEQVAELYMEENDPKPAFKIYEKLYLTHPDNQQYRKNYFELARNLGVQPVFIEHSAATRRSIGEDEEQIGAEVDVTEMDDSLQEEFSAEASESGGRPLGYRAQLTVEQRGIIEEYRSEAEVFVKYGLHDNAISRLRDILDIDPWDIATGKKLCEVLLDQNRIEEFVRQSKSVAELAEALNDPGEAIRTYDSILRVAPGDEDAVAARQRLSEKMGGEAVAPVAAPARPAAATPMVEEDEPAAYKAKDLALGASTDVDVDEVITEFRRGISKRINPKDYETHYNLGIAYREMGLLDAAISEFRLILNFPDMVVDGCANLGMCYIESGEFDKSIRILEFGVQKAPEKSAKALAMRYDLAKAHEAAGHLKEAVRIFQTVEDERPGFRDTLKQIKNLKSRI